MAGRFVLFGLILGAAVFILKVLIEQYPAEHADWNTMFLLTRLLLAVALMAVFTGAGIALWKGDRRKRKRIGFLLVAIVPLATLLMLDGLKTEENDDSLSASVPARYEFTSDWVSENVSHWSQVLAPLKGQPNIQALEVGSFEGRSAIWFLESVLTHESASLTCVDIFYAPVIETRFDQNIAASGVAKKVTKVKGRSDEALKQFKPNTFDFIYIDGSHDAKDVMVDAMLAWEILKPGGIIIFDDYQWTGYFARLGRHRTPKIALNAFLDIYAPYIDVLHKGYQLSVRKRDNVDLDDDGTAGRIIRAIQLFVFPYR